MAGRRRGEGGGLERMNAIRNAAYTVSMTPLGFEINLGYSSFQICGGSNHEIELLYTSLGLSGPDDFAIQPSVWAAAVKFHSELSACGDSPTLDQPPEKESGIDFKELNALIKRPLLEKENGDNRVAPDMHKDEDHKEEFEEIEVVSVLPLPPGKLKVAAPPTIRLPPIDRANSTWDLVKSFAPEEDDLHEIISKEVEDDEGDEGGGRVGETVKGCAESISEKVDEAMGSRGLTEDRGDVIGISPHGSLKRTISSWEKGELLGRGSFGAVYEAMGQ